MNQSPAADLFGKSIVPDDEAGDESCADQGTGVLPYQEIQRLIRSRWIDSVQEIEEDQIQPASLDLRLDGTAYRVKSSFLPGDRRTVRQKIDQLTLYTVDLTEGAVLEKDCVYIVPLQEHLDLRKRHSALANPKSSTGRLDIFARVITDQGTQFDRIREGYRGPVYAEISPRAFGIRVRKGSRLVQLRIRHGSPTFSESQLRQLHERLTLVGTDEDRAKVERGGMVFTVDVTGSERNGLIGFKARKNTSIIDVDERDFYDPLEFWDPVFAQDGRELILDPDDFYILASKEPVSVPRNLAAEMLAYDTLVGEFRVHYAGFFDPGFGLKEMGGDGTRAVLEVRSHEVPFLVEDGQVVGRLVYEPLTARPDRLYGQEMGSSYQRQGLTLSKQFKTPQF